MLHITYSLNALLMIALPLALGWLLTRRFGLGWRLFWIGGLTFIGSQVVHLPLNFGLTALFARGLLPAPPEAYHLLFNATVLGLTAGLSESLARYVVYRWWIKAARTWREGVLFGAGHGGVEAIILGLLAGLALVQMIALRQADLSGLVPPEQLNLLREQVTAYWSAPWYASLLGAVERVFALTLHVTAAVLVLQVFRRNNILWLPAAIGWHALADAVTVYSVQQWGIYVTEGLLAIFALLSLVILLALRPRAPEPLPPDPEPVPGSSATVYDPDREEARRLDDSRYLEE